MNHLTVAQRVLYSLGFGAFVTICSALIYWGDTNVQLYSWEIGFTVALAYYVGRMIADRGFAPSGGNGVPALLVGIGVWLVIQLVLSVFGLHIVTGGLERGLIRGAITAATMFTFSGSLKLRLR